ncbi:MAG: hypothetical protein OXC28_17670 [Defluviicoccus sp.]|nr:hypothetical protein [Defluviicoccus sp.]
MTVTVTIADMARAAGVPEKIFRRYLRRAEERGGMNWHRRYGPWNVVIGSPEHAEMSDVLIQVLLRKKRGRRPESAPPVLLEESLEPRPGPR